jgi:hypothetical protein
MVKNSQVKAFKAFLDKLKLKYSIMIENVQDVINVQKKSKISLKIGSSSNNFNYGTYNDYSEIRRWINLMSQTYPSYVTVLNVGNTFQKNSIMAIKISIPSNKTKKAFWIDGGIHAREWISPSTVIYIGYSVRVEFFLFQMK